MIKTVYTNVEVEVEIDTGDFTIMELVKAFKQYGCPEHLMDELMEWANQPVPNLNKLEKWLEMA